MSIWQYYTTISRRLLLWSGASIAIGTGLALLSGSPFWQGVGTQAVAWGLIDGAIALAGTWITRRRRATLPDPDAPDVLAREARTLRRILWINAGLDVLYVTGGVVLALTLGATAPFWNGTGWGIAIQGGFLLLFDSAHALGVSAYKTPV